MRKATSIAGSVLLFAVVVPLFTALVVLFGWLWAILVLVGKIKIGPRLMWTDQTARRDFAVRRTEVKVAGGLFACYIGALLMTISLNIASAPFEGTLTNWVSAVFGAAAFLIFLLVGFPLAILWKDDWERTSKCLKYRYRTPVLF